MFDIVVCHGPNDDKLLDLNLFYNSKNIVGKRNIYVITHNPNLTRTDCIVIHESTFPFTIQDVEKYSSPKRYGWYLQQLLKLYAHTIPNISENYLVIDCDTLFLKPTTFFENDLICFNYANEYHPPYFEHLERMSSTLKKQVQQSGICHHMMFTTTFLKEMFHRISQEYNTKHNTHYEFWEIMLVCIDPSHKNGSGFSEYEMYFNYMILHHRDKIKLRPLQWDNSNTINLNSDFNYISCHWYL
jgi:hypothetical protein